MISKFGTIGFLFIKKSMKKIFLSLVALFLILLTVHILMPTYGGLLGV